MDDNRTEVLSGGDPTTLSWFAALVTEGYRVVMHRRHEKVHSLLHSVQNAAVERRTNAYQIAKATGLPLRSVQKLLRQTHNPTLRNIEVILTGLGLSLYLKAEGTQIIPPAKRARPSEKRTG